VRELVVVVCDLYLSPETPERQLPAGVALPGLQRVMRYGDRTRLASGWRPWVAEWLAEGRESTDSPRATSADPSGGVAAATVAAMGLHRPPLVPAGTVWMATPVHLIAGMSSVHLDRRSILRLTADDLAKLSEEFRRVFHDSGFVLEPLDSGDFLLFGPPMNVGQELEPARLLGSNVAEAPEARVSDPALRRLTAEIEMWLHEHRINDVRARRGELPVTGLWFWGGGFSSSAARSAVAARSAASSIDIAFGRDAYLQGLLGSMGRPVQPLPSRLADVFGYAPARRALLVIELGSMLQSNPTWSFFDALAHLDQVFIQPAVEALGSSKLERLMLLANDRLLTLRARDRFKIWRRAPLGLSGLQ
jgi:hypothetical protein